MWAASKGRTMPAGSRSEPIHRWSGWVALAWAAAFAYLGLSSEVPPIAPAGWDRIDLLGHAAASFLLAILLAEWLVSARGVSLPAALQAAALGAFAFGLMIEALQTARPLRGFEALDVVADLAGSLLGAWAYLHLVTRRATATVSVAVVSVGVVAVLVVVVLVVLTM